MSGSERNGTAALSQQDRAALARKHAEAIADLRALQCEGWVWSDTTSALLVSPHDSQVYVRYDRAACELIFSPKVISMMVTMLQEEQEGSSWCQ